MSWTVDSLSYDNRKEITIQTTNLDANQSSFPILIKFADTDIGAVSNADGFDIRFTASDGTTLLKYERQSFAIATGTATGIFWVKTDLSTAGTSIYIYYRSTDTADGADPTNVWDANYKGVYHMTDMNDSTANAHHLTNVGADTNSNGKIGACYDFIAANTDYAYINENIDITTAPFTMEAWFKPDNVTKDYGLMFLGDKDTSADYYGIRIEGDVNGDPLSALAYDNTEGASVWAKTSNAFDTGWNYGVHRTASTSSRESILDVNFANKGTDANTRNIDNVDRFGIGAMLDSTPGNYYDGLLDEVRISNIARTDAWLKFVYYNINEADNELTYGAEETPAGGGGEETASYSALNLTLTIPAITASFVYLVSATFSPVTIALALQPIAATYVQTESATYSALNILLSISPFTASYEAELNSTFTPVSLILTSPPITADYTSVLTASFTTLNLVLTIPSITTEYAEEYTASFMTVPLIITVSGITSSYLAGGAASFAPLSLVVTIPLMTAVSVTELSASFTPLSFLIYLPSQAATYVQEESATFTPLSIVLTVSGITAVVGLGRENPYAEKTSLYSGKTSPYGRKTNIYIPF